MEPSSGTRRSWLRVQVDRELTGQVVCFESRKPFLPSEPPVNPNPSGDAASVCDLPEHRRREYRSVGSTDRRWEE